MKSNDTSYTASGGSPPITATSTHKGGRPRAGRNIRLVETSYDILEEIQPASVRAVCYRLFAAGVIESMAKKNTGRVSKQLTQARERGDVPWEWLVDETRSPEYPNESWSDPAAFLRSMKKRYRKDHWALQPNYVEVWSEKGTVRGTLAPVLEEYGVTFRVFHGYASATVMNDVANESSGSEKPWVALYVGDFDPSGMSMSEKDIPERLERYDGNVEIIRLALREDDLVSVSTFHTDTKRGDPRHDWFLEEYGHTCAELDALSPVVLRERVGAAIKDLIDDAMWQRSVRAGEAEEVSIRTVLDHWGKRA